MDFQPPPDLCKNLNPLRRPPHPQDPHTPPGPPHTSRGYLKIERLTIYQQKDLSDPPQAPRTPLEDLHTHKTPTHLQGPPQDRRIKYSPTITSRRPSPSSQDPLEDPQTPPGPPHTPRGLAEGRTGHVDCFSAVRLGKRGGAQRRPMERGPKGEVMGDGVYEGDRKGEKCDVWTAGDLRDKGRFGLSCLEAEMSWSANEWLASSDREVLDVVSCYCKCNQ
ncbi:hypothetical protein O3P69_014385 [Scylla paramamosain]|uniref:Uncharacterized protein n=1 Tax=Scylla paramamosain TaxID=85552 RepID=A0AAW0TDR6_SCYPA